MKEKDIKEWIRSHFNLHGNQKIRINKNKMKFQIRMGDCESVIIEFPKDLKRQLLLCELLD